MKKMTRRQFLEKSAFGMGAVYSTGLSMKKPMGLIPRVNYPLGFQIWTVREMFLKDFPGSLKMIAEMGYESIEMCSPPGYGFKELMSIPAKEMKQIINDAGLIFTSTHYNAKELRENLDERIQFAADSGQKQMILSSFGLPSNATLDDWKKAADELNRHGEKSKKAGIQMGFHNHHGEFANLEGRLIYDVLLETFDPDLVKMQFQVAVINIGFKAADYFRKYPGRFISAHLADYSEKEKKTVALGKGMVDWNEFFDTAAKGGVKNIFVEMELDTFRDSAAFIAGI